MAGWQPLGGAANAAIAVGSSVGQALIVALGKVVVTAIVSTCAGSLAGYGAGLLWGSEVGAIVGTAVAVVVAGGLEKLDRAHKWSGFHQAVPIPVSPKLDKSLMDELAESGVKYNPDDVIMITKTPDGKLIWLETGNERAGLMHIIDGHAVDFANKGITDIPNFLHETLEKTPINNGIGAGGCFADYLVNGSVYRVVYGTNGFVVSFYPI